tara:strand:- start:212 stop:565 length:354 start_codon:yes stop_codon:yes gene_type:complete
MKNIIYILLGFFVLTGCYQPTALVGPAITGATSGNIYNVGLSYTSGMIIKEKTGKTTTEYLINAMTTKKKEIQEKQQKIMSTKKEQIQKISKQINVNKEEFFSMVERHISKFKKINN